ncbi:MAG TPA: hypothetical protein VGL04_01315 [Sporichthyaceae bacterium]
MEETATRTRRLRLSTRVAIIVVALALLGGAVWGAITKPVLTPLYAVLAFGGVAVLLLLRDATVSLTPDHLIVQNMIRVYALPVAGIRRPVTDARGGVSLVVYFHPDYPPWPQGKLPHGWRAKHRRKRLRQIRVFALTHDDAMLPEILRRGEAARVAIELGRNAVIPEI